jgi:hypothetical protein
LRWALAVSSSSLSTDVLHQLLFCFCQGKQHDSVRKPCVVSFIAVRTAAQGASMPMLTLF